jgi:hypothetical protein
MVLLTLELLGDGDARPQGTYTLDLPVTYRKATLVAVDLHAPSTSLVETWSAAQTGDSSRKAYAPIYVDIEGIAGDSDVRIHTDHADDGSFPRTLIPIGDSKTAQHSLRTLGLTLRDGDPITYSAGHRITAHLYTRSVEGGTFGNILPIAQEASDGEGGTTPGGWTDDSRCTLYIELE